MSDSKDNLPAKTEGGASVPGTALRDFESKIFTRVNPAVRFSVTRYVLAIGIFVAIVAFGLVSTVTLGVDLMPSVSIPVVAVFTSYPGSDPTVVDQQVTQVVENAVSTVSGITDMNSSSNLGSSRVVLSFDTSVDKNAVLQQVAAVVNSLSRRLPSGVQTPVVRSFDPNSQPVIEFGVTGGGASLSDVNDYVQNSLAPLLERVDGVANINVSGAPSREFQVLLDPNKLKFYSLSPTQVVSAISGSAFNQPIGTITTNRTSLTFSTSNTPTDVASIERILVDSNKGIAVRDIAVVRDMATEQDYVRINGIPSVLLSIQRTADSNAISVVDGVKKLLAKTELPKGYEVLMGNDTTGSIRASVNNTFNELFMTLFVVAIIVLLFIGKPNMAFSVILAVPIAISASPILYKLAGFSFNLVSLLAMVTAIGIVVDDSIVVAENVDRYRKMGYSLKEAVLKGASEVFSAVIAASLSLLSVLMPVSFMGGFIGMYIKQFSLGLAAAVALSLLEAVLFLTVRLAYTPDSSDLHWKDFIRSFGRFGEAIRWGLKSWKKGPGIILALAIAGGLAFTHHAVFIPALLLYPLALGLANYVIFMGLSLFESISEVLHGWTERFVEFVRDHYVNLLGRMLKRSAIVLVSAGLGFVAIVILVAPHISFNFVPNSDSGSMSVNLFFPPGTSQYTANMAAARVEAFLATRPEVASVQSEISNRVSENLTLVPIDRRPGVSKLAPMYRAALQPLILKDFPTARISVGTGGFGGGGPGGGFGGSSVSLSLVSFNMDLLLKENSAIVAAIQSNPYVADVSSSLSDTSLENDFVPNPAKMSGTGITAQSIANSLQTYTTGTQASNVVTNGLSYPIMVQLDPTAMNGGQTLLDLPIYSSTLQTNLQIGQLGSFVLSEKPTSISRYNRQYTGSLSINLKPNAPTVLEVQKSIIKDLQDRGLLDKGISITSGSAFSPVALAGQLQSQGVIVFLLAFFLAYLVMAAQFNSWRYPIYLLMPVPLAIVGAILVVWIVGGGLDIFGVMGMLMLIGLSAKNAILYLDFVVERLGKMPIREALLEAARLRFRPIVMTTLTVLVISGPLVFSRGQGAEFGQRMGIVMFGGIMFSAILTFFVVPAAFFLFERNRQVDFNAARAEIEHAVEDVEQGLLPTVAMTTVEETQAAGRAAPHGGSRGEASGTGEARKGGDGDSGEGKTVEIREL
ncbi:MAG TPA: efflux RND transporter permease subunit [Rectinemataceae bacterium]|nr:efflux RND transporter permease subunit [Rectinemataceae bacterium]